MKTSIVNATIVTGDGETVLPRSSLIVEDVFITQVYDTQYIPYNDSHRILDARGGFIIPGLINHHSHEVAFGPNYHAQSDSGPAFFGKHRWPIERIFEYLDKHLLDGTTTLLSLDGLTSVWEVEAMNKLHPINIRAATIHSKRNMANILGHGGHIDDFHANLTAEQMISEGAVAIGETGVPSSPYGLFEFCRAAGRPILIDQAKRLASALFERPGAPPLKPHDEEAVTEAISRAGLEGVLTADQARQVALDIERQHGAAELALKESAELGRTLGVPVIAHHSAENADLIARMANEMGPGLIAAHSNHMFTPEEAVTRAGKLKAHGTFVDVYSGDAFGVRQSTPSPETIFALLEAGLVDLISTDFLNGCWDPILLTIEKAVEGNLLDAAAAIAMATGNVTRAIPKLAPNRGLIEPGKVADLVVTAPGRLSEVKTVMISGRVVVDDGRIAPGRQAARHP